MATTILTLPRDLVYYHLLPNLSWNDLLRLRRTCSHFYGIVTDYMQHQLLPSLIEVEINEDVTDDSFDWVKSGMHPVKLFVNNDGAGLGFFESERIQQLASYFGESVTSLRIATFPVVFSEAEMAFFQKFRVLNSLEIDNIENRNVLDLIKVMLAEKNNSFADSVESFGVHLPASVKNVQVLRFNVPVSKITIEVLFYSLMLTRHCQNVEQVGHTYSPPNYYFQIVDFGRFAQCLTQIITHELPQLKVYDMKHFYNISQEMQRASADEIVEFFGAIHAKSVTLINFNAELLLTDGLVDRRFTELIESMADLNPVIQRLDTTRIRMLTLHSKCCILDCSTSREEEQLNWPNVMSLEFTIDSLNLRSMEFSSENRKIIFPPVKTIELLNYVFSEPKYTEMVDLTLVHDENFVKTARSGQKPIPRFPTDRIVNVCPNVRKLTLVHWQGTNKSLLLFWKSFKSLAEVSLTDCENLGNVAFVGEDTARPVFFGLKVLKKLELHGLDRMPKITDTLFRLVIKDLELKELVLTSSTEAEKITFEGLSALKTGRFAATIEKFKLGNLSLKSSTPEDLAKLEKEFRSANMI